MSGTIARVFRPSGKAIRGRGARPFRQIPGYSGGNSDHYREFHQKTGCRGTSSRFLIGKHDLHTLIRYSGIVISLRNAALPSPGPWQNRADPRDWRQEIPQTTTVSGRFLAERKQRASPKPHTQVKYSTIVPHVRICCRIGEVTSGP